jgi:hypothetical protein
VRANVQTVADGFNSFCPHNCCSWREDLSVATHVSADRLEAVTQLCLNWEAKVAVAVYTLSAEQEAGE